MCYFLHSGREGTIYFDTTPVADVRGDTDGDYETTFAIPLGASPGPHTVSLRFANGGEIGAVDFVVSVTRSCAGDCNHDGVVTITELMTGVLIELGARSPDACPALICCEACPIPASIDCLVTAVTNALTGCPR
jgi:hypothetical protein